MSNQIITKRTLEFNADVFIIPNAARVFSDQTLWHDDKLQYFNAIGLMNGIGEIDKDTTKLIELWFVSEDLGTTNLCDHGAMIKDTDGTELAFSPQISILPADLFYGAKEGDTIDIKFPYDTTDDDIKTDATGDLEVTMHVTLAQKKYRYARFGTFQECFLKVGGHKDMFKSSARAAATSWEAQYMDN